MLAFPREKRTDGAKSEVERGRDGGDLGARRPRLAPRHQLQRPLVHVSQGFFPRTSAWDGLKRALKATFEESVWDQLAGAVSAVLAGGRYRLVESGRQAQHPWFFRSFDFTRNTVGPADRFVIDVKKEQAAEGPRVVTWTVDGKGAGTGNVGEVVQLARGSRLAARNPGGETVAIFAVPERWKELMTMSCFPSWFEPSEEW
jgi:hypothetical protein